MPDPLSDRLPTFPWDTIAEFRAQAQRHPDGLIDLSVGAPVDHVPLAVRSALADASDAPGYPGAEGLASLRGAYRDWLARAHGVSIDPADVLPTIGSKELIAALPTHLGFGSAHTIAVPELAYPTYEVGAVMAGCQMLRMDAETLLASKNAPEISLLWLNSPSNPTGAVLSADVLRRVIAWARSRGVTVAADECYIDLGWDEVPESILSDEICGGDHTGLLAIHSLSKRSNMAGYRLGFVAGDRSLVAQLLAVRKHSGLVVPAPVQAAGIAALSDDAPVQAQRARYAERRDVLAHALERAGFTIDESAAGLYLWATARRNALDTVAFFAERGVLVAPGTFYGPAGAEHVRLALTASDEQISAVSARLAVAAT